MDKKLLTSLIKFIFSLFKSESKELYHSLEMRRPQNLDEQELRKKLRLIP